MQPPDKEESRRYLSLDRSEQAQAALADYAGRIGTLLSAPAAHNNPDIAGSLDDLLGAVYALIQAKQFGFANRSAPIDITAVEKRAKSIARGKVRTDGKWVAGFYFNNALFRTAAVLHRILKIALGKKAYVPVLLPEAQASYPHWSSAKLAMVHDQVNDLKHTPRGIHDQRTVSYEDTVNAVGELLDLIEAWMPAVAKPKP
jgi:hypothetical protein